MATPPRRHDDDAHTAHTAHTETFSNVHNADTDDKATHVEPTATHERAQLLKPPTPQAETTQPIVTIINAVDTIHRASVDLPNSDSLANVLLRVQQVKEALLAYQQAEADLAAQQAELANVDTNVE